MKSPGNKWNVCEGILKDGISCKVTVSGHSMRPLLRSSSIVEIRPYGNSRPALGDIVFAKDDRTGRYLMHRIIQLKSGEYILKGDNCEKADKIFTKEEILGKVLIADTIGRLSNLWPAKKTLALASHSGRRLIKAGMALKKLINK